MATEHCRNGEKYICPVILRFEPRYRPHGSARKTSPPFIRQAECARPFVRAFRQPLYHRRPGAENPWRIKPHCPTSYCDAGKGRNAKRGFGQEMGPMVCGSTDFECYQQRKINLPRLLLKKIASQPKGYSLSCFLLLGFRHPQKSGVGKSDSCRVEHVE